MRNQKRWRRISRWVSDSMHLIISWSLWVAVFLFSQVREIKFFTRFLQPLIIITEIMTAIIILTLTWEKRWWNGMGWGSLLGQKKESRKERGVGRRRTWPWWPMIMIQAAGILSCYMRSASTTTLYFNTHCPASKKDEDGSKEDATIIIFMFRK